MPLPWFPVLGGCLLQGRVSYPRFFSIPDAPERDPRESLATPSASLAGSTAAALCRETGKRRRSVHGNGSNAAADGTGVAERSADGGGLRQDEEGDGRNVQTQSAEQKAEGAASQHRVEGKGRGGEGQQGVAQRISAIKYW